jgi:hypothetical protein
LHDKWGVHFNIIDTENRPIKSFKDELLYSCELMYDDFKKHTPILNVFFSGGTDSECLVRCFHKMKIPINPLIIKHKQWPYASETVIALDVCSELGITPTIFELDLIHLFDVGILHNLALKYQTRFIAMLELLYIMEHITEPTILGDEVKLIYITPQEKLFTREETDHHKWFFYIEEDLDGVYDRFQHLSGIPMIADSFRYTPQSWAAMILTPEMKDMVFNDRVKASGMSTKNIMMSREFGVKYRKKTNVFEDGPYRFIRSQLVNDITPKLFPFGMLYLEYRELLDILDVNYEI